MAVWLYSVGLSFRTIAALFCVNASSVYRWIRDWAEKNYEKPIPEGEIVIELDEMWHFIRSKKQCWIWKAYCRTTGRLIDWECGDRSTETFDRLLTRLERLNVTVYFSDRYSSY